MRIEFVRTIDGQVEFGHFLKRRQRNAKLAAEFGGSFRGRHADDRQAALHALGKQPDEFFRGRTGANAQPHAVLDMRQGRPRRFDFQSPCVHGPIRLQFQCPRSSIFARRVKPVWRIEQPR